MGKIQNPKNCLDQKLTPKNPMPNFLAITSLVVLYSQNKATPPPSQKNPGIENFKPKIVLRSSPSLEIQSDPPGHSFPGLRSMPF